MTRRLAISLAAGAALLFASCTSSDHTTASYDDFPRAIEILKPTPALSARFNGTIEGARDSLSKEGTVFRGYVTTNRLFMDSVMTPLLLPSVPDLKSRSRFESVNALTLFVHEMYRTWFGPGFYRWGGDLLDMDDPQEKGSGCERAFGLDCSGFASAPYELAVRLGVLTPREAAFSSEGFKLVAAETGMQDRGGRNGTSNRFRIDTHDIEDLGREVTRIPRGTAPTSEQLAMLRPGDIVWRSGHVGIIAFIDGEPYYLESGGWVLPSHGNVPYRAGPALEIFARRGELVVRRCLGDDRV